MKRVTEPMTELIATLWRDETPYLLATALALALTLTLTLALALTVTVTVCGRRVESA